MYFSNKPVQPNKVDQKQYEKLKKFKEKCQEKGLFVEYSTNDELSHLLIRHISQQIDDLQQKYGTITTKRNQEIGSSELDNTLLPEKTRVIKNIAQTIFTPMSELLEQDRDFFSRGYNIEQLFRMRQNRINHYIEVQSSPNKLLSKLVHEPDTVLKKYLENIQKLCDEYDIFINRLETISVAILNKKDLIWVDFQNFCNKQKKYSEVMNDLPEKPFNDNECQSLLFLAIADANVQDNSIFMANFYLSYRDEIHAFLMDSPMKEEALEYMKIREDYFKFSEKFSKILTQLSHEWQRKYYLIEPDLKMPILPITRLR